MHVSYTGSSLEFLADRGALANGEILQVASVLQVDDKTSALVVVWCPFDGTTAAQSTPCLHQQAAAAVGNLVVSPPVSLMEQKLLASILKGNAALVPKDFKVEIRSTEKQFHTSVLLPIGPLEYEALSKLNSNVGCAVCGKRAVNRCSQCQSASYCGAGESASTIMCVCMPRMHLSTRMPAR